MLIKRLAKLSLVVCGVGMNAGASIAAVTSTSGSINITGNVYANGCTVATPSVTVRVPMSMVADYTAVGTSGETSSASDGEVSLTNCPQGMSVAFTVNGQADTTDPTLFQVTPGTGKATGVGLKLQMDSETSSIVPNSTTEYYSTTDQGGTNGYGLVKHFRVTPVSTATAVTAGLLDTNLTFTVSYK